MIEILKSKTVGRYYSTLTKANGERFVGGGETIPESFSRLESKLSGNVGAIHTAVASMNTTSIEEFKETHPELFL